jgi:hypothetical protein
MQTAEMKVQWCVFPTNILLMSCQLFLVPAFFLLASIRQMYRLCQMAFKYLLGMQCLVSFSDGLAGYPFPLYNTHGFNPYVHRTLSTLLCRPKLSQPGPGYKLCA